MEAERLKRLLTYGRRAVEQAVDAALAELVRQTGPIDPQILKEARSEGIFAASVPLTQFRSEVY